MKDFEGKVLQFRSSCVTWNTGYIWINSLKSDPTAIQHYN